MVQFTHVRMLLHGYRLDAPSGACAYASRIPLASKTLPLLSLRSDCLKQRLLICFFSGSCRGFSTSEENMRGFARDGIILFGDIPRFSLSKRPRGCVRTWSAVSVQNASGTFRVEATACNGRTLPSLLKLLSRAADERERLYSVMREQWGDGNVCGVNRFLPCELV